MFSLFPILAQIFTFYVKPQELIPALQKFSLLYLFLALILFGMMLDMRLRLSRMVEAPQLRLVGLLFAWALITVLVRAPHDLAGEAISFGNAIVLYLAIAHGVQTLRSFQTVATLLLLLAIFLSFIAVHQGLAPKGCFMLEAASRDMNGVYDGRHCELRLDCERNDGEPGAEYLCAHVGLLGTSSVADRVRYRGQLEDPNELALATAITLPFAFALLQQRKSALRLLLAVLAVGLIGTCMVFTQSRGGQIVFLVVMGTYLLRRYGGVRGLLLGAIAAVPVMLLGGRSGDEAEGSSMERLECWQVGVELFKEWPVFGAGKGQFTEHHFLTAHNSYVLSGAELGLPGLAIWSAVLYLSLKITISALRVLDARTGPEAADARAWAGAMLASMAGLIAGIFFLSFSYHPVLWIHLGLAGALATIVRRHLPDWRVRVTFRELAAVAAVDVILMGIVLVYTKLKLH